MSTDERYDEVTVALVATTLADELPCAPWPPSSETELLDAIEAGHLPEDYDVDEGTKAAERWIADKILTALADAGLLLPPGGEKTTAIGHWSSHRGYLYECGGHNDECPWPIGGTFVETRWPDGSRHIGPWTEVPDDPS